jgi:membrane peptidoglycan carboxypeptidase
MTNVGGVRVAGGTYPTRIWQAYMGPALAGQPILAFAAPPPQDRGEYLRLAGEPESRRSRSRSGTSRGRSTTTTRATPKATTTTTTTAAAADDKPGKGPRD